MGGLGIVGKPIRFLLPLPFGFEKEDDDSGGVVVGNAAGSSPVRSVFDRVRVQMRV